MRQIQGLLACHFDLLASTCTRFLLALQFSVEYFIQDISSSISVVFAPRKFGVALRVVLRWQTCSAVRTEV